ncbi:MAG: alpha/beta fold hydrolase [Pseudorhodobacter sp.]|nr:alpha/beta fold hydrolase [Pseudorhodobacter sp.]
MNKRFLLVHGSCHGAWCWRDIIAEIEHLGHSAEAIDLPGHGQDKTPLAEVTLDLYAAAILEAVERNAAFGPTIVVGHSMAGYAITAAAERAPENIAQLIYVCAYAPISGKSLADMRREGPRQLLADAIVTSPDRVSFQFDPAKVEAKFYHDCPDGTLAYAQAHLTPQPILPQETPLRVTERSGKVPKRYIRCADDRAIPPEYQVTMSEGWADVFTLDCSHSPFFAQPRALAKALI